MTDKPTEAPSTNSRPETGYAPVNGLQMYYEIHGSGGTPLLLLHGGLFNIDLVGCEQLSGRSLRLPFARRRRGAGQVRGGAVLPVEAPWLIVPGTR